MPKKLNTKKLERIDLFLANFFSDFLVNYFPFTCWFQFFSPNHPTWFLFGEDF
jgi:hypothetical protein